MKLVSFPSNSTKNGIDSMEELMTKTDSSAQLKIKKKRRTQKSA